MESPTMTQTISQPTVARIKASIRAGISSVSPRYWAADAAEARRYAPAVKAIKSYARRALRELSADDWVEAYRSLYTAYRLAGSDLGDPQDFAPALEMLAHDLSRHLRECQLNALPAAEADVILAHRGVGAADCRWCASDGE